MTAFEPGFRFSINGTDFLCLSQSDYYDFWPMLPKSMVYLIQLTDPQKFVANLPPEWQPPTQAHPRTGLPNNLWCGVTVKRAQDLGRAEALLNVRARVRWIEDKSDKRAEPLLLRFLEAWRCSNCGHRGDYYRPPHCPHAMALCGDAKLEPQIHLLIDQRPDLRLSFVTEAKKLGITFWPELPIVPGVTT